MTWDQLIYTKIIELKKELLETINQIKFLKVIIILGTIFALLFLLLFVIKIVTKKFKELEEVKPTLRKLSFQLIFFIFWKQLPGGFASFMASLSLFLLMLKLLKAMDFIIIDIFFIRHAQKEVLQIFRDIVKAVIWLIIILIMLKDIFGFSIQDIAITSAVVTAALAFAFQDTLINLIGGISISIEKSFKLGDFVQLKSGENGVVIQTSWRTTRIKNRKNQVVIVPNKELASAEIVNFNYYNQVGRIFNIGVAYKNPPYLVKKAIKHYLLSFDEVSKLPAPEVFLKEYQDFSILYEVRYYIHDFDQALAIDDKIKSGLWYLFKRNGFEIPFPIRNVYLHQPSPEDNIFENAYIPEDNLIELLPQPSIIDIQKGSLGIFIKSNQDLLHKLTAGTQFTFDAKFKINIGDNLLFTPLEPSECLPIAEETLTTQQKEKIVKTDENIEKTLKEYYEKLSDKTISKEKRFIEHFMNINLYRDGK